MLDSARLGPDPGSGPGMTCQKLSSVSAAIKGHGIPRKGIYLMSSFPRAGVGALSPLPPHSSYHACHIGSWHYMPFVLPARLAWQRDWLEACQSVCVCACSCGCVRCWLAPILGSKFRPRRRLEPPPPRNETQTTHCS